ncbi:hypothetical protein OsI_01727 [Oryza sativa Indica Group]|uniref:Uncharacterized protein n=1 Tax=Oryza sativa subsp. indica TaxID=39946 RepID=A2WPF3_ORYSI|nr:hypothetical protein OsI_01727 [Oryza sativa Indica Group]
MGLGNSSASDDDNCGMRVEGRERSAVGRQAGADQAMGSSIAANLVAWGSTTAPTLMTAACGWKGGTGRRAGAAGSGKAYGCGSIDGELDGGGFASVGLGRSRSDARDGGEGFRLGGSGRGLGLLLRRWCSLDLGDMLTDLSLVESGYTYTKKNRKRTFMESG